MAFNFKTTKELEKAKKQAARDDANYRNFETYNPTDYEKSDELNGMWGDISGWSTPTWDKSNNTWWNKLTSTMQAIENREPFSYDVNGDALYQQYKDQYVTGGKMAMMDTMGQAAAMTGGYGNSYAQSVGQQAYQGYLQQLTDKIPELYSLALDKYNSEGNELYNRLSSYGNLYSTEYGEHRDSVADSKDQLAHLTDLYNIKSNEEYNQWYNGEQLRMAANEQALNKLATTLGISTEAAQTLYDNMYKSQYDNYSTAYTEKRDAVADEQWQKNFNEAQRLANAELAEKQRQFNASQKSASYSGTEDDAGGDAGSELFDKLFGGDTGGSADYSDWDSADWNSYFAVIRQTEGQASAEAELKKFTKNGLIPTKYVSSAASGARGGKMGH